MKLRFLAWLMILIAAVNVTLGSLSYAFSSEAPSQRSSKAEIHAVNESDSGSSHTAQAADCDDPFQDHDQGGDCSGFHQDAHNCHIGHCHFIAKSPYWGLGAPDLIQAFFGPQDFFYLGVDLSTSYRPPLSA